MSASHRHARAALMERFAYKTWKVHPDLRTPSSPKGQSEQHKYATSPIRDLGSRKASRIGTNRLYASRSREKKAVIPSYYRTLRKIASGDFMVVQGWTGNRNTAITSFLLGINRRCRWGVVTDGWPSGRRRAPGKCVYVKSVSWVRIPPHPPYQAPKILFSLGNFLGAHSIPPSIPPPLAGIPPFSA
jgi:hypothetical protein